MQSKEQGVHFFRAVWIVAGHGSMVMPVLAGDIYKTVDAQGHVTYSDHAQNADSTKTDVRVDQPNAQDLVRLSKEQQIQKAEDLERKKKKAAEDQKKAIEDRNKQALCDAARNRYYSMKDVRRMFDRDADGNRVFYSDKDADAKRDQARDAMTAACGG